MEVERSFINPPPDHPQNRRIILLPCTPILNILSLLLPELYFFLYSSLIHLHFPSFSWLASFQHSSDFFFLKPTFRLVCILVSSGWSLPRRPLTLLDKSEFGIERGYLPVMPIKKEEEEGE
jgi:hypothetical protein